MRERPGWLHRINASFVLLRGTLHGVPLFSFSKRREYCIHPVKMGFKKLTKLWKSPSSCTERLRRANDDR